MLSKIITMAVLCLVSCTLANAQSNSTKKKNVPYSLEFLNLQKRGHKLVKINNSRITTPTGTEISLNRGEIETSPRRTIPIKESSYSDSQLTCLENLEKLENNIGIFTALDASLSANIYPGQLMDGLSFARNGTFRPYVLPSSFQRMPYKVSFSEFLRTDGLPLPVSPRIEDIDSDGSFDKTDYLTARGNYMTQLGGTLPSVSSYIQFHEINSLQQVESELGITINAGISPEAMALFTGLPLGIDVNVNVNSSSNSQVKRSRLLAMVIHEYYNASVVPSNDNYQTLIDPIANNSIPQSVAYVKSVIYGAMGFVMFESSGTMDELKNAVSVGLGINLGIGEIIDAGNLNVSVDTESRRRFESSSISVRAYGIGLNGTQPRDVSSISSIKEWMLNFTPFSNGNYGQPIKFIMNYINNDDLCTITYRTNIVSKTCNQKPRTAYSYDVKLKLAKIEGVKVVEAPFDYEEDLFGKVYLTRSKVGSTVKRTTTRKVKVGNINVNIPQYPYLFFDRSENSPLLVAQGPKEVTNKEIVIATNKSYNDLKNMSISLGYWLKDKDVFTPEYECQDCTTSNERVPTPLGATQLSSINSAEPDGDWVPLKYGKSNFFQMNFFEKSTNRQGSHIRFYFQIWVRAKSR